MAPPAQADHTDGGLRALSLATVFAAASGYVVLMVAARALGAAGAAEFSAFWGLFFALGGVANGLMQESTRAVRSAAHSPATHNKTHSRSVSLLRAGALMGLGLALAVALSAPVWPQWGIDTHSGIAVVVVAVGIIGFSAQAATAGALSGTARWSHYALLLTLDALLRLVVAALAWALGGHQLAFCLATVAGTIAWVVLWVFSTGTRSALRAPVDVTAIQLWRNTSSAMLASAGASVLVTGFPVLVTATARSDDPPALIGAVNYAITVTRAPLLVPLTSFQSAIIVYFVQRREHGARAAALPLAAISAIGVAGAGAAWLLGPWLLRVLFGSEFELPGVVLAGLTLASVGTAALMVTGNAALAHERHGLYNLGWWVAVAVAVAVLAWAPAGLEIRATTALLAGPVAGILVHLAALTQPATTLPTDQRTTGPGAP